MKSEPVTLTDDNVWTLQPSASGRETFHWDQVAPGFGLRIRETGSRSLVAQYKIGSKHRRITLGTVGKVRVTAARKTAMGYFEQVGKGEDPAAHKAARKAQAAHTIRTAIDAFLKHYREHGWKKNGVRSRTLTETERYLLKHAKSLHPMAVHGVTRQHVADMLGKVAAERGGVTANRARSAVSTFFQWAVAEGLRDENPVSGTLKRAEKKRDRVLTDAELAAIWINAPESDYGRILKLLMITGCRLNEIAKLRWSEVNAGARMLSLPGARTKTDTKHKVWLTDAALALLPAKPDDGRVFVFGRKDSGFQGFTKPKAALDEKLGIPHWTPHAFRHTIETELNERFSVPPHVTNALLGHVSGAGKQGSQGNYNHATYFNERKSALEKWSSHVMVCVAQAEGANVTAFTVLRSR